MSSRRLEDVLQNKKCFLGCVIMNSVGVGTFSITDAKLYDPVVTLSTEDNGKLLKNEYAQLPGINP